MQFILGLGVGMVAAGVVMRMRGNDIGLFFLFFGTATVLATAIIGFVSGW